MHRIKPNKSFIQKKFHLENLNKANEEVLGKLFSYFMLETVVISNLQYKSL